MKKIFFFLLMLLVKNTTAQQTVFETSKGTQTATYFETIAFYKQLDIASKNIEMKPMGETDAGYPLHIVLVSSEGVFAPEKWRLQKKVVIMINNGIHPGEPDGIDASMLLVRDVKAKKINLPSNVVLAIIPVYNIGGCLNRNKYSRVNQDGPVSYGFRGNAQNLDLNRDFTKNDSKESKTFAKIFHWLQPNIFLDNHVTDGADFQHTITLITTQYEKLGGANAAFLKNDFEPQIYAGMKQKKWDLIPYIDFETNYFSDGVNMFYDPPRYSSGYAALFGTLAFISETHMLKPFNERVKSTYDLMVTFIEKAATNATAIVENKRKSDSLNLLQHSFPLSWALDKKAGLTTISFKGFEQDSMLSEATGLKRMYYEHKKPYEKPLSFYNIYTPTNIVVKPKAYIIPAGWHEVIERLKLNGVEMEQLVKDEKLMVYYYKIESYKSRTTPYEKHHKNYEVKVTEQLDSVQFLKGDFIVYTNQKAARYIVEMLEPTGDDGFFAWNFFDAILQQKEGYSDYRWEDIAARYLKENPSLKILLEEKKKTDVKFANNAAAQLDFIYKHSPYYEKAHNRCPVYKLK
jgi:Zinc carboxypeptidase